MGKIKWEAISKGEIGGLDVVLWHEIGTSNYNIDIDIQSFDHSTVSFEFAGRDVAFNAFRAMLRAERVS